MAWRKATPEEIAALEGGQTAPAGKWRNATPDEIAQVERDHYTSRGYDMNDPEGPQWLLKGGKKPEAPTAPAGDTPDKLVADIQADREKYGKLGAAPSKLGTAASHFADTVTFGFADEAAAAAAALGRKITGNAKGTLGEEYRATRDNLREYEDKGREFNPGSALAGTAAGIVATLPVGAGAAKGVAGAPTFTAGVGRVLKAGTKALPIGAAYGAGESRADLTKGEVGEFTKDVAKTAATTGAIAAGGKALGEVARWATRSRPESLDKRLLNEATEGEGSKVSATERKRLFDKVKLLRKEIVEGPQGKEIRKAYLAAPEKGQAAIGAITDGLDSANQRIYEEFAKAGRGSVPLPEITRTMDRIATREAKAGNIVLSDALRSQIDNVAKMVRNNGEVDLTAFRRATTHAGIKANAVIGGLTGNLQKQTADQLAGIMRDQMNALLTKQAKGLPELQATLPVLRENNVRMALLIDLEKSLGSRAYKEGTGRSTLIQAAEKMSHPAATGAALGAASGVARGDNLEERLSNAIIYGVGGAAFGRALPWGARSLERARTSFDIARARGNVPVVRQVSSSAPRIGEIGGRSWAAQKLGRDDEENQR